MGIKIEPELHLRVNGGHISARRIAVLTAVELSGSQNKAASLCGISVPVLSRHLHEMESITGVPLIKTDPKRTILTPEGKEILKQYREYVEALRQIEMPTIACTPVSSPLIRKAADRAREFMFNIIESDDCTNILLLQKGIPDMVVFDDPVHVYNHSIRNPRDVHFELFQDTLLHHDAGPVYQKLRYGAQRIGFNYLERKGIEYAIKRVVNSIEGLLDSGLSFFINRSLLKRLPLPEEGFISSPSFNHSILALRLRESMPITHLQTKLFEVRQEKKH